LRIIPIYQKTNPELAAAVP